VLYLGWFDGNPSTLNELPPAESAAKFVEYMGGADSVIERARQDYDAGNYRWVAEVMNKVVFADPGNQAAKNLTADALEQLGYQAESGPWRNFYLSGAQELRNGVAELPTPHTASPDTVRAMSLDLFFDYLGVRLNSEAAADSSIALNFDFGDADDTYLVELENGVLNHTAGQTADDADATITLTRDAERYRSRPNDTRPGDHERRRDGRRRVRKSQRARVLFGYIRVLVRHRHAVMAYRSKGACRRGRRPRFDERCQRAS